MKVSWEEVLQHNQVNECCNKLMSTIGHIVDKFIKQCRRQQRSKQLPWLSDNVRQLMKQRDYSLKSFLKTQNDTEWTLFKGLRNHVVEELHISKPNYHIQVLSEAKGNGNIIR